METLPNGARVLKMERIEDGWLVLAQQRKPWGYEYVTWLTDEDYNCFHGHYSSDVSMANSDFNQRLESHSII